MRTRHGSRNDYTQYVHEYVDKNGRTLYAVGQWDESRGEYYRPMDAGERAANGGNVFAYISRDVRNMGAYTSRTQALRRARYLFGQRGND
jgi:hypothetical protein